MNKCMYFSAAHRYESHISSIISQLFINGLEKTALINADVHVAYTESSSSNRGTLERLMTPLTVNAVGTANAEIPESSEHIGRNRGLHTVTVWTTGGTGTMKLSSWYLLRIYRPMHA